MGSLHALEDLEPLLKILYTFVCKKVSGKITDKCMENLKEASGEILARFDPEFFRTILCFVALVYKSYFFSEQTFYGNYSALDYHTNTVISHTFAYSSVEGLNVKNDPKCNKVLNVMTFCPNCNKLLNCKFQ